MKHIRLSEEEYEEEECADIGHRDPDTDHVAEDQIQRADQKSEDTDLTDTAGFVTDKQIPQRRSFRGMDLCQRGSGRDGIYGLDAEPGSGHDRPRSHRLRECDDQEDTRRDGRVYEVVSETAEHLLDDHDRKSGADHDHVWRKRYRQVHRQKKTGHDSGQISDRIISLHDFPADILEKNTGRNRQKCDEYRTDTEVIPSGKGRREKGDDHIAHDRLGSRFVPDVRGV